MTENKWTELKLNWTTIYFWESEINRIPDSLEGNYIIWSANFITYKSQTNYVGKGKIKSRLNCHLKDPKISKVVKPPVSQSYISYISISKEYQEGIENFLARILKPKVEEEWSTKPIFSINLPWGKSDEHYIYLLELIKQSKSIQSWVIDGRMTIEQAMDYIGRVILHKPVYKIGRN